MTFQNPLAFLLLLLVPLLVFLRLRSEGRGHPYPSFMALSTHRTWRERLVFLPEILILGALIFLTIALARPQKGFSQVQKMTKGIAIEVVIDRSSSMKEPVKGDQNRLDVVKELFAQFVSARPNDMIGLISFAAFADTNAPLTLAHDVLPGFIGTIELAATREEDGTAIGDALALGAARLYKAEEEEGYTIKSRVMILLTDGVNNRGEMTPKEAAELAAEWGVKIYPIGFSSERSGIEQFFGASATSVDQASLKAIAEITGGEFFLATDEQGLAEVFNRIDELETSEVESYVYREYKESFLPFAVAGLLCLLFYIALSATLFRRLEL